MPNNQMTYIVYNTPPRIIQYVWFTFLTLRIPPLSLFQDINKRLSLPADIRLPEGYLEKFAMNSPPFDKPMSRRLRRASLVSTHCVCVYVCVVHMCEKQLKLVLCAFDALNFTGRCAPLKWLTVAIISSLVLEKHKHRLVLNTCYHKLSYRAYRMMKSLCVMYPGQEHYGYESGGGRERRGLLLDG